MSYSAFDVRIVGVALETDGLVTYAYTVSGLPLVTFGFLTPCADIWGPADEAIVTTWVDCQDNPSPTVEDCPE